MPGYVALGWTGGSSSRRFIGRYKSIDELRDLLRLDRLSSSAIKHLYIFKICDGEGDRCLWLISFDLRLVMVRRPNRSSNIYRRPSHEYSEIRRMLYSRLCGSVDLSTYICLEDESSLVRGYLDAVAPGHYILEAHKVRPYDDRAREWVRRAIEETIEELTNRAQDISTRLGSMRPNNRAKALDKAQKLGESLRSALTLARIHSDKLRELGIEVNVEAELEKALKLLETERHSTTNTHRFKLG
ncbi:MAG: hypothetical protein RQ885_14475 [Desulfurococcales archaeon]|nr:hypothetical protein [Desulfurococcales archaeon]